MARLTDNGRLRWWLRATDISQAELAKRLKVSRQVVGHWYHGHAAPSVESCRLIADALGLSFAAYMSDEKPTTIQGKQGAA